MPTLGEQVVSPFKALVFGQSKIGKTFGAGSFPRPNFLDFDGGTETLGSPEFIAKYGWRPSIQVKRFTPDTRNSAGVPIAHKALDEACIYYDHCMLPEHKDTFDTWVIDTGTTLYEASQNKAIILLGGKSVGITSNTHSQALSTGLIYPKMQDYGAERSMAEQFIYRVLGSGKNVLLLCHEYEESNDAGQVLGYRPLLRGGSKEAVGAHFTEIYRLTAQPVGMEVHRKLTTKRIGQTQVGSRLGVPDGTEWSWEAIQAALTTNAKLRK